MHAFLTSLFFTLAIALSSSAETLPPDGCSIPATQAAVRTRLKEIQACYVQLLEKRPDAKGRLSVELHIDDAGKARFLGVKQDDLGDETTTRCIFAELKAVAFTPPRTAPCIIVYPFNFSATPRPSGPRP